MARKRKNNVVIDRFNLDKFIANSNKTQRQIAEEVGVHEATFSKIKSGAQGFVTYELGEKIRKAVGYPQAHLFYELAAGKPLGSFTPTPPAREEAKKAFEGHKADADKVRENLQKLTGEEEAELLKLWAENAWLRGFIEGVKLVIEGRKA